MNATALSPNPAPAISRRTMLIAFVFCFLGLLADGVDLMFPVHSLNSLKAEFGLSNFEAGSLGSLTLAGMAVGGIYGGWCCDRFGRVRVVTWTIVLFSIGTALLGLTQNYWQFALIRFVASLGLGSLFVACNILMSECVGTRYRTTILAAMQAGWTVGYLVATLLAGQIIPEFGWRTLFFTAVAPALVCLALRPWVPESPSGSRPRPGASVPARLRRATPRLAAPARWDGCWAIRKRAACSCSGASPPASCCSATTAPTTGCRPTWRASWG